MKKKMTEEEKFERVQNSTWALIMEKIFNMIILNLNIILCACLGLIVFGIGPAMLTSYQILDDHQGLNFDTSVFKKFFKKFLNNLIIGNVLFYGILCTFVIITISLKYYALEEAMIAKLGMYIMGLCLLVMVSVTIVIFPIFSIYREKKIVDRLKIGTYLTLVSPLKLFIIDVKILLLIFVYLLFPQFIMVLGFGSFASLVYYNVMKLITNMNNKIEQQNVREDYK